MNHQVFSKSFASLLISMGAGVCVATATPAEESDKQFLAQLEQGSEAPAPARNAPTVAKKEVRAPAEKRSRERAAVAVTKREQPAKREAVASRSEEIVEVRRAVPVTTVTKTSRHDHDDEDNDHDDGNGFFDRLFRGEKVFR